MILSSNSGLYLILVWEYGDPFPFWQRLYADWMGKSHSSEACYAIEALGWSKGEVEWTVLRHVVVKSRLGVTKGYV